MKKKKERLKDRPKQQKCRRQEEIKNDETEKEEMNMHQKNKY